MKRARIIAAWLATLAIATLSCRDSTDPGTLSTGLTGSVTRGPITPVCMVDVACDAPFAAHFTVREGSRTVAAFQSDSAGRFEVRLAPGNYIVVPGSDAPIISPGTQTKGVTVGPSGLTSVELGFDTGIR